MAMSGGEPHVVGPCAAIDEHPVPQCLGGAARVRRIGRLRLPVTLTCQPWATLYRLPDGRLVFCVRLWGTGGPVTRVLPLATVRAYARRSRLDALAREIDDLLARSSARGGDGGR